MTVSKRVLYSGQVQGVGFRYTAQRLAESFAVAGYVRNLSSGEVELVAEGEADEVKGFLEAVAAQMAGYVRDQHIEDAVPAGAREFAIRA